MDTGEGEEEEGGNMEAEGEEETMAGEIMIEAILGLERKMTVPMDKNGETEVLLIGTPLIRQVTSRGVAVEAQSRMVKINLPLGIFQRIINHL